MRLVVSQFGALTGDAERIHSKFGTNSTSAKSLWWSVLLVIVGLSGTWFGSLAHAQQQQAPMDVWCAVASAFYGNGQAVCDTTHPQTIYGPTIYPSGNPYGPCTQQNGNVPGYAGEALVCPVGYLPVNSTASNNGCYNQGFPVAGWGNTRWGANVACQLQTNDPWKQKGCQVPCNKAGNPIEVGIQNKYVIENDYTFGGPDSGLKLERTYNSLAAPVAGDPNAILYFQQLGPQWSLSYESRLLVSGSGSLQTARVLRPDGRMLAFTSTGGSWLPDQDIVDRLERNVDGSGNLTGWTYWIGATDAFETYDASGKLASIAGRTGTVLTFSYSDGTTSPPNGGVYVGTTTALVPGLLLRVTDAFGRQLTFQYALLSALGTHGVVANVTDPSGQVTTYKYDTLGNLVEVDYPATPSPTARKFVYENTTFKRNLTGIIDENASRYSTYAYDSQGLALSTQLAGGVSKWSLIVSNSVQKTVIDPLGNSSLWQFQTYVGVVKKNSSATPCAGCTDGTVKTFAYDANGNASSKIDFNNVKTCYSYDPARNLETARVEGALSTENCTTVLATLPSRPDVRKTSTQWHATWHLPIKLAEPNRITTLTYNGDGAVFCAPTTALVNGDPIGVVCSKSVQATTDTTGQQGFNATVTGTAHAWQYTYDSFGQVLTATDPNSKTTTYVYYAASDPDMGKRGNLQTVTNPAGHITTYASYDLNGRPLSITDPNGTLTTLTYAPRGWLTSRTVGGEATTYTYDNAGQLTRVTQPDGSYVQYTYDGAHRLTDLQDGLGNKIHYTLDNIGNRIKEDATDPSNTLARTQQRVYDSLNRLHQTVGAQ
jgi:YD repeat-containing protein